MTENIFKTCNACQLVNASSSRAFKGAYLRGQRPGEYWKADFTEIKPTGYGNKYLLVFIDTFSRWTETFPYKKKTAQIVAKKMIKELFPWFDLPKVIESDNRPAFVAQVSQGLAKILGVKWKIYCAYRPQSSGQIKKNNK